MKEQWRKEGSGSRLAHTWTRNNWGTKRWGNPPFVLSPSVPLPLCSFTHFLLQTLLPVFLWDPIRKRTWMSWIEIQPFLEEGFGCDELQITVKDSKVERKNDPLLTHMHFSLIWIMFWPSGTWDNKDLYIILTEQFANVRPFNKSVMGLLLIITQTEKLVQITLV